MQNAKYEWWPAELIISKVDAKYKTMPILWMKVSGVLELDQSSEGSARYVALDKWNNQLNNLQKLVVNKMAWELRQIVI